MEKVLKELNTTWTSMAFETEPHTRTKIPLLKPSDELIETLEDNQVRCSRQIHPSKGDTPF
jgi:dynein heavy chain, axonemal